MTKEQIRFLSAITEIKKILLSLENADAKDIVEVIPELFCENQERFLAAHKCVNEIFENQPAVILPFRV